MKFYFFFLKAVKQRLILERGNRPTAAIKVVFLLKLSVSPLVAVLFSLPAVSDVKKDMATTRKVLFPPRLPCFGILVVMSPFILFETIVDPVLQTQSNSFDLI